MTEPNTFYYTVSTIPQILAATSAIIGVFLFYRLDKIQKFLVGDGKAILERSNSEISEETLNHRYKSRLIDAVHRENFPEIKEVLKYLSDSEKRLGYTKTDHPTGFQYVFEDRFCTAETTYKRIKLFGFIILAINVFTIICSVISLRLTDRIMNLQRFNLIFNTLILLFLISLLSAIILVIAINYQKTIYEDLDERDKVVSNNKLVK